MASGDKEPQAPPPTIEDILSEGEAMMSVIEQAGGLARDEAEAAYGSAAIECRKMALSLLTVCVDYLNDRVQDADFDEHLVYYHACIAAFIQGASVSERLISEAQYVKAAAVLKQDYELLTRIHEAVSKSLIEGRQPNVKRAPAGSQLFYGELNRTAHPADLDALVSVLSYRTGGLAIPPVFVKQTAIKYFKLHVWICSEMVGLALDLLKPSDADHTSVQIMIEQYELLRNRVTRLLGENTSEPNDSP